MLVGQPELQTRLELPELRQLKQRIGMLCTIPPMTSSATRNYIRTRLRMAGARDLGHLHGGGAGPDPAYAGGIPRVVNTVCDHCLLIGYADQTRRIDADIVDQALSYLHGGAPMRSRRRVASTTASSRTARSRSARSRRRVSPVGGPGAA